MALINKVTIQYLEQIKTLAISVKKDSTKLYLSIGLKTIHGFEGGKLIEFNNDGDAWTFWLTDNIDGFKLLHEKSGAKSSGVSIGSSALCRMLLKSTGKKAPCAFYVQKTESQVDGRPVFEILTKKTIEEMGKE